MTALPPRATAAKRRGVKAGEPDRDTATHPQGSLAARLALAMRAPGNPNRELAAAIAVLIALGPLATLAGAQVLAARERAEILQLRAQIEPRLAAERAASQAYAELSAATRRPAFAATLEALARGLPADATLARVERTAKGALELDVLVADPDKLRAALRRDPALARLRDTSQRQADAMMVVSLREEGP